MSNHDFDFLNDLPRIEMNAKFRDLLESQIEIPNATRDQVFTLAFPKYIAPIAMAASLAAGVFFGNSGSLTDVIAGLGLGENSETIATNWGAVADPYNATFTSF